MTFSLSSRLSSLFNLRRREGEREGRQFEIKKEIFLHNTSPPQPIEHWQ